MPVARAPRSILFAAAIALLCSSGPVHAQGLGKAVEDHHNLGALGLSVDVSGTTLVVRSVHDGGPAAAAGVRAGDVIESVASEPLTAPANGPGPTLQVVAEVERCEAEKKKAPVVLGVRRGGAVESIEVTVAKLGAHARTCPEKCKKCAQVVEAGLAWLAKAQRGDGSFPTDLGGKTGLVVVTSLGGLAFLSAGAGGGANGPLERATNFVLTRVGKEEESPFGRMGGAGGGNWNQANWELAYGLVFLSEMARKTKRPEVKAKVAELVTALQRTQEQSGGWAHGPGGPNALGYLELEIVSNYALLGLGAARRLGVEVDEASVGKALTWIESTASSDGGVGYSPRPGQKGGGDPGRTAGALVAYAALGQKKRPFFEDMAGYYTRRQGELEGGHVSPCMHLLAGAMAGQLLGDAWRAYMERYRLTIMAARRPDGSFASTPTQESQSLHSNTDLTVGPCWTTATYVTILSLPGDRLPLLLGGDGGSEPASGKREASGR